MPDKKEIIIFVLLCIISLGLGYWSGLPDNPSQQRAEAGTPPAPTVVTNTVTANPQPTPAPVKPRPQPTPVNSNPSLNAGESAKVIEAAIRKAARKPTGELTTADFEKVTELYLDDNQLTDVKGLENLTQLTSLHLWGNHLTDVRVLEKFMQLERLDLRNNPDLTKAQIDQLQKALPRCIITSNAIK